MSASVANKVASIGPLTGVTGSIASTPIYTPTSDALLRISLWCSPELRSDPNLSIQMEASVSDINGNIGNAFNVGTSTRSNNGSILLLQSKANEPVLFQINVTESTPGSIAYSYQVVIEEL